MAQFKKKQDIYSVTNNETIPVTYEVKKLYDCVNFLTISDGTIEVGETEEFDFIEDGEYQIVVNGTETTTIYIKHYLKLLNSIIEGVLNNICDCNCGCECLDESEDPLCNLLMLRAKIDVYKRLINPQAVAFFDIVGQTVKCLIEKPVYCAVDKEIILGESECNKEIVKQLISLDYLALYFFEYVQACLTKDKEYVRNKFNTSTIFCCIQTLGIDVGDIEQLINENMGTFTINSGAYVNQAPSSVGDYSIKVLNRATTVLTLDMFTTLTTPAYADPEGDLPQSVRIDTLPGDGVLKLSGANVTAGQIILVADINAGNLTYESPDQDALDTDTFDFSVSDVGSGMFTS